MARSAKLVDVNAGEMVDIESLLENPRNPNRHPEGQLDRLMASLTARGQYRPILARKANRMLIAGHGVRRAAKQLGWQEIRVVLWDVDQETADQAMLGDNRLGLLSVPDKDRISELLAEMPETDWFSVGFSPDEAEKLLKASADSTLEVREIESKQVYDTFWISVRGPLTQQAAALQSLKELMKAHPGVTVDLGTTEDA